MAAAESAGLLLLAFGMSYLFLTFVPNMWKKVRGQKTIDYGKEDDEAVIRIDAKKKFCQQVKFAMRLKRQMKRFKQRRDNNNATPQF